MNKRNELVELYVASKRALVAAQTLEMETRKKLIAPMIEGKLEGSVTEVIGEYKVTATAKVNRVLDPAVLDSIWENLDDFGKEAIKFKPTIVLKNYRDLEERGHLLMEAVTVKPATPGIKVEVVL
jgi:hypothetical protein